MQRTAQRTAESIKEWYAALPENYFDSTNSSFPDGTSKRSSARSFMRPLSTAWKSEDVTDSSFAVSFRQNRSGGSPWGLRLHQYGGVITPKRARALTIPLTAEARGLRVAEFVTRHALFCLGKKGGKGSALAYRDEDGSVHLAYALRSSVSIPSLRSRRGHDAIPTAEQLRALATPHFLAALMRA